MTWRSAALLVTALLGASLPMACAHGSAPSPPPVPPSAYTPAPADHTPPSTAAPNAPGELSVLAPPAPPELSRLIRRALVQVSAKRELSIKTEVRGELIDRQRAQVLMLENIERNVPRKSLLAQGELLRALGLIPADYAFVEELLRFANGEITGLYDPRNKAMYMLRDVPAVAAENALLHELAHALHDQHFDLGPRLKHDNHSHGDSVAAQHSMAEGDATSVAFLVQQGVVPEAAEMRAQMLEQMSQLSHVPALVRESLVTPYTDGLAFVEALRAQGGWGAVDAAWKRPPRSTEQLLHLDKYRSDEAPLPVAKQPAPGPDWQLLEDDVIGEQGLRVMLTQWSRLAEAQQAAAGWGGDRYAVFTRQPQPDAQDFWAVHSLRFDSQQDARQAMAVLRAAHPSACRSRASVGPLTYAQRGALVVMAGGPYRMQGGAARALSRIGCAQAQQWVQRVLATTGQSSHGGSATTGRNGHGSGAAAGTPASSKAGERSDG